MKMDYNFIEVLPHGVCFNIKEKKFEKDPKELKGSPRAFVKCRYDEKKIPYPRFFVEGNH